ncbi:MAG TPA: SDR family NAD(P)-dependent oxidoreductase [Actinomycetota bacterium]|nr:SDR family NAD(P)-dependent oxidoreductase [Actinomycetota bacterium]
MTGERLAGKTAIVVGAGQTPGATIGNGRATALRFAQEGAHLLLVDRDDASVKETQALILEDGGKADVAVVDISLPGGPAEIAEQGKAILGRIDILHNNVGIGMGDNTPTKLAEEAWDRIFDVNLKAMWLTCKEVVPIMRRQNGGAIVCVSSLAAIAAAGHITAYKISKAGVNALVHSLAITNAHHGIRVNGIMPGFIDTPMAVDAVASALDIDRDDLAKLRAEMVPLKKQQGTAWDVANAALFLASNEAAFITGAVLPVDGGQSSKIG